MANKKYKFHYDAGHGWLEVSFEDIRIAGIQNEISGYSYFHHNKVYLEEDCDAALFEQAMGLTAENFIEVDDGDTSIIRTYDHCRPDFVGQTRQNLEKTII